MRRLRSPKAWRLNEQNRYRHLDPGHSLLQGTYDRAFASEDASYETVRWFLKFGPSIAANIRRSRPETERSLAP